MNKAYSIYKTLYFGGLASALFYLFSAHSLGLWSFITDVNFFISLVAIMFSLIILIKSCNERTNSDIIWLFLFSLFVLFSALNTLSFYYKVQLWLSYVLVVGARGIKFREIVKFHFILETCFMLINVMCFYGGWVDKTNVFLADERESVFGDVIVRESLGYPASTDFATHLLYLMLDYWIIKHGILKKIELLTFIIIIGWVFVSCEARQASVCMLLIVLFSFYISHLTHKKRSIGKVFALFLVYSIPFFFIITFLCTIMYDDTDFTWVTIDLLLSGRLHFGYDAITEYGIHLFSQKIWFVGAGFAGVTSEYNYVDSGYLQFLLLWGIILMTTILYAFVKIGNDAYKRKDIVLLFALLIMGISTIITQFWLYLNYCVLILALTASHDNKSKYNPTPSLSFHRL